MQECFLVHLTYFLFDLILAARNVPSDHLTGRPNLLILAGCVWYLLYSFTQNDLLGLQLSSTFAVSTCSSHHLAVHLSTLWMWPRCSANTTLLHGENKNKTPASRAVWLTSAHPRSRLCRDWPSYPITLHGLPTPEGSPVPSPPEAAGGELSIYKLAGSVFLHHRESPGSLCDRTACGMLCSRQAKAARRY